MKRYLLFEMSGHPYGGFGDLTAMSDDLNKLIELREKQKFAPSFF